MRWSMQMAARDGRVFGMAFELDGPMAESGTRGTGTAWIEDADTPPQTIEVDVEPANLALMVRALRNWPIDLLDEMASRDLDDRKRQADTRPVRRPDDTLDMEPGDE